MSTLIQCPACSQKFNLQGRLPALFTCTKCQQPMDLTSFPGYVPEPAAAAKAAAPERGGGRASRRRPRDEEEHDEGRRHALPVKKNNSNLIIWAIVPVVGAIIVVIMLMSKHDSSTDPKTPTTAVSREAGGPGYDKPIAPAPEIDWKKQIDQAGTPAHKRNPDGSLKPESGTPTGSKPDGAKPGEKSVGGPGAIQTWSWPEDVSAEDKQKIDKALETAINDVGSTQRDAQDLLVKMNRKAIWRLVSEFKHIQDTLTFENRKGKIAAMIVDKTLRKIDGFMERRTGYRDPVNPESTLEYLTGVAKRWNGWLETGMWKEELKPWDPRVDETDEPKPDKPARSGGK